MKSTIPEFMDRAIARVDRAMMVRTVEFVTDLPNRLEGDRLSIRVTPADIARHFGPGTGPLRVQLALRNLLRRQFVFYRDNGCISCPLIVYLQECGGGPDLQLFFSKTSRKLLQNQDGHWRLDRSFIDLQDRHRPF